MGKSGEWASKFHELRRKAERIIKESRRCSRKATDTDLPRLIHDLEVHQEELQTQNEELQRVRMELEESRRAYSRLYDLAPIGYVSLNGQGQIVNANVAASEMLARDGKNIVGRKFSRFVHPKDHGTCSDLVQETMAQEGMKQAELRLLRGNGNVPFWVQVGIASSRGSDSRLNGWLVVFSDISGRKQSEEELRAIPSKLIAVQEEERKRLSSELHDSIGQTLAALKFTVELVLRLWDRGDLAGAFAHLERFVPTIQKSIDETRAIYTGLRPKILEELGLVATMQWFCREFMELYPEHHVELEIGIEERDIPEHLKIALFRIIQEGLNNIARHSRAQWVDLWIRRNQKGIELTIEDDGEGMDLDYTFTGDNARSLGLTSMRERAELTGGAFSIQSSPAGGTIIHALWPIRPAIAPGDAELSE